MFYDVNKFPYLKSIVNAVDDIVNEFDSAEKKLPELQNFLSSNTHFASKHIYHWAIESMGKDDYYPEDDHRDEGVWAGFPLYKTGFPVKDYDVEENFPITLDYVKSIPNVFFATYMRLTPGGLISTHQHKLPHLIFHICLEDNPGGSEMICGESKLRLEKKGDYALFDYRIPHSTKNYGSNDRLNLVIDFQCDLDSENLVPAKNMY